MLVLLCIALCICLIHFYQFEQKGYRKGSNTDWQRDTALATKVVWLSLGDSSGFYSFPVSGLPLKDIFSSLKLPIANTKKNTEEIFYPKLASYSLSTGQRFKALSVPTQASPFFFLPININEAEKELLTTLPGIGPQLAQNIITYRDQVGQFSSIKEIVQVDGVGEKKFEKIKGYLSL